MTTPATARAITPEPPDKSPHKRGRIEVDMLCTAQAFTAFQEAQYAQQRTAAAARACAAVHPRALCASRALYSAALHGVQLRSACTPCADARTLAHVPSLRLAATR